MVVTPGMGKRGPRRPLTRAEKELLDEYAMWMRSWNASKRTITARITFATARLREWHLEGFTVDAVRAFMAGLSDRNLSEWTISTYHTHLGSFAEWLVSTGRLDEDPVAATRPPKRPTSEPRPLSDADLTRVMAAAVGQTRDWMILALHAGLRAHEIAKIKGEDVQPEGLYVLGKGKKPVTLPCHPVIWEMAQSYPRSGYWFPGSEDGHVPGQHVSAVTGKFFTALGIDGSIHRLRHSYGTRLLRSGVHIRKVQKLMRHASLSTTASYTAVDEDELRDAILKLPAI